MKMLNVRTGRYIERLSLRCYDELAGSEKWLENAEKWDFLTIGWEANLLPRLPIK